MQHLKVFRLFCFTLAIHGYAYAAIISTDTWDDGLVSGWQANTGLTTVEAKSSGGNPNGWLYTYGDVSGSFDIGARTGKSDFRWNYIVPEITSVSVDINFISGNYDAAWLRFQSATDNGWFYPLTTSYDSGWKTYTVAFNPSWTDAEAYAGGWLTYADIDPTGFPSQPFSYDMARVDKVEIRLSGEGILEAGIDNFQTIPEPSSLALLVFACVSGSYVRRRLFR